MNEVHKDATPFIFPPNSPELPTFGKFDSSFSDAKVRFRWNSWDHCAPHTWPQLYSRDAAIFVESPWPDAHLPSRSHTHAFVSSLSRYMASFEESTCIHVTHEKYSLFADFRVNFLNIFFSIANLRESSEFFEMFQNYSKVSKIQNCLKFIHLKSIVQKL